MILEILKACIMAGTAAGIAANIAEQAIENGDEWIALDYIADDAAESLNATGLTAEWTAEEYAALEL